jgi:hypothetical protein
MNHKALLFAKYYYDEMKEACRKQEEEKCVKVSGGKTRGKTFGKT